MGKVSTALVIGGGIAGPVTALALRRAGIEATVFESHPSAADGVGAMLSLAPNGIDALRVVGAHTVIEAIGQPVPGVVMADGGGRRLSAFHGFPGLPATRAMARADLFRALADFASADGIHLAHGKRLVAAEDDGDSPSAAPSWGTGACPPDASSGSPGCPAPSR